MPLISLVLIFLYYIFFYLFFFFLFRSPSYFFFFFFNDPAPTEFYTLPLHDALPISGSFSAGFTARLTVNPVVTTDVAMTITTTAGISVTKTATATVNQPSITSFTGPSTVTTGTGDRKSTRLNSSHLVISYAVFCLKK